MAPKQIGLKHLLKLARARAVCPSRCLLWSQVAAHEPGSIAVAAALHPTAFHTEDKRATQALHSSSAAPSPADSHSSEGSLPAVIDVPDSFALAPSAEHQAAPVEAPGMDHERVRVAVRQTAAGVFVTASAAHAPPCGGAGCAPPSAAQTAAAVHAALCAIQAGTLRVLLLLKWRGVAGQADSECIMPRPPSTLTGLRS